MSHQALLKRREKLREKLGERSAVLFSGGMHGRNYRGNPYPFRASSHFLYFVGRSLVDACFVSTITGDVLFVEPQSASDVLWHGEQYTLSGLSMDLGLEVRPLSELSKILQKSTCTIPGVSSELREVQSQALGREVNAVIGEIDHALAQIMVDLRSVHDDASILLMRETVSLASEVHGKVPGWLKTGLAPTEIWALMQAEFTAKGYGIAYNPIITCRGEVLHGGVDSRVMESGDLLLLDVGCEHPLGWASDISRTWPVSGVWSSTQKAIFEALGLAQDCAIEMCRADVEYAAVHGAALSSLTASLRDLGILRGSLDTLLSREVGATFFPHGVGHLLGLDVHDMEDLGDLAGYGPGRQRSEAASLKYLRLNRPLEKNMIVTIEPGFYQIPQLLEDARETHPDLIDWRVLEMFKDVRGIRLEDDVLIGNHDAVVLSDRVK